MSQYVELYDRNLESIYNRSEEDIGMKESFRVQCFVEDSLFQRAIPATGLLET